VALGPAVSQARVLVHGVTRAEEPAEQRRAHSADCIELEVEEHRAENLLAFRRRVVKKLDAVELRVVDTAILAVATEALFVAHHLQKLYVHMITALACLHAHNFA
jgi:hypothetical protein